MIKLSLLWQDPLLLANKFLDQEYLALFYDNSGNGKSFLCLSDSEILKNKDHPSLEEKLNDNNYLSVLDNWFGYILGSQEHIKEFNYPDIYMIKYNIIFEFNNRNKHLTLHVLNDDFIYYALSRYNNIEDSNPNLFNHISVNIKTNSSNSYFKFCDLEILSSSSCFVIKLPNEDNNLIFEKKKLRLNLSHNIECL